jgi:hypothetical protein
MDMTNERCPICREFDSNADVSESLAGRTDSWLVKFSETPRLPGILDVHPREHVSLRGDLASEREATIRGAEVPLREFCERTWEATFADVGITPFSVTEFHVNDFEFDHLQTRIQPAFLWPRGLIGLEDHLNSGQAQVVRRNAAILNEAFRRIASQSFASEMDVIFEGDEGGTN